MVIVENARQEYSTDTASPSESNSNYQNMANLLVSPQWQEAQAMDVTTAYIDDRHLHEKNINLSKGILAGMGNLD